MESKLDKFNLDESSRGVENPTEYSIVGATSAPVVGLEKKQHKSVNSISAVGIVDRLKSFGFDSERVNKEDKKDGEIFQDTSIKEKEFCFNESRILSGEPDSLFEFFKSFNLKFIDSEVRIAIISDNIEFFDLFKEISNKIKTDFRSMPVLLFKDEQIREQDYLGFRQLLKCDPDIIVFDSLINEELVYLTSRAIMTGHKVFVAVKSRSDIENFLKIKDVSEAETFYETIHFIEKSGKDLDAPLI